MAASAQRESTVSSSVLLFQIDSADGCFAERVNLLAEDQITHLKTLLAPQSSFESRLRQDVQSIMESIMREDGQIDIVVLASRLALIGHKVSIRTAVGGGSGQECFRNLNYEFLLVAQIGSEGRELIVDPKFREQFKLSQQTDRYTQLLNLLPDAYIGQHMRLATLVRLLSSEMESAFSETGITMPPWRQIGSMMSKWKPLKSKDTEVNSPTLGGISPRGALSLCSSRSSSSCSDCSPQRSRSFTSSLQRQESIPRKIQSGFNVDSSHVCSRIPEYTTLKRFGDRSEPGFCQDCACSSEGEKRVRKAGYQDFQPGQESQIGPVQCKTNLGLAKIRTVKLGGPVR